MEVACRAIILNEDKLLLCKQKEPQRDFWTLPGGSVENGETLSNCVSREVSEETGIEVEVKQMLFIRELIDDSRHRIEFYFLMKSSKIVGAFDSVSPQNEIEELEFIPLGELATIRIKPDCLPELINMIYDESTTFPMYLGKVT